MDELVMALHVALSSVCIQYCHTSPVQSRMSSVQRLLLLLLLLIDLYSAVSRMKHESERCDGAEPSYGGVSRCEQFSFESAFKTRKAISRSSVYRR